MGHPNPSSARWPEWKQLHEHICYGECIIVVLCQVITSAMWHVSFDTLFSLNEQYCRVLLYSMSIVLDFWRWRGKSLGRCSFRAFHLRHSLVYSLKLNVSSDKHEHSRSRDQQPERTCLLVTCYAMYHLMQHAWWKNGGGEAAHRRPVSHSEKHMQAPLAGWTEALVSVRPFNRSFFNDCSRTHEERRVK